MKKFFLIILCIFTCCLTIACDSPDNNITYTPQTKRYEVIPAPTSGGPYIIDSATDGEYNYYILDLGYVKNMPIASGVAIEYNGQTPILVSFEKINGKETSVTNALTTAVSHTITTTSMGSATFKISQEFKYVIGKTGLSASYSRQWGSKEANSNSTENTYTTASTAVEQMNTTISYTIGDHNEVAGTYRLSLIATCDVYAFIQTPTNNSCVESITYSFSARSDSRLQLEYDENNLFAGSNESKIELPTDYYKHLPIPEKIVEKDDILDNPSNDGTLTPLFSTMNRYNCNDDNGYNKDDQEESEGWRSRHNGYEIGQLALYGCTQNGTSYKITDKGDFAIRYHVLQDVTSLPNVGDDAKITIIENDTATSVKGTNIDSQIGHGAYWVRIDYTDGSQDEYHDEDILKNADDGKVIDFVSLDNLKSDKDIKSIHIVVAYEICTHCSDGWLNINTWREWSNWRCEYSYNFK